MRGQFSLSLMLLVGMATSAEDWRGTVQDVPEGDTLSVTREGELVEVRLFGIDCPNRGQALYEEARNRASSLCLDQEIHVDPMGHGGSEAPPALVHLPSGKVLNHVLVKEGQQIFRSTTS